MRWGVSAGGAYPVLRIALEAGKRVAAEAVVGLLGQRAPLPQHLPRRGEQGEWSQSAHLSPRVTLLVSHCGER
jgi:hypothetical protein